MTIAEEFSFFPSLPIPGSFFVVPNPETIIFLPPQDEISAAPMCEVLECGPMRSNQRFLEKGKETTLNLPGFISQGLFTDLVIDQVRPKTIQSLFLSEKKANAEKRQKPP